MKHTIISTLQDLVRHRRLMVVLIVLTLLSIGVIAHIALTVKASEALIFTHYTFYGAHLYRNSWTYLLSFIAFIVIAAVCFIGISLKLLRQDREPLALLFGWVGIVSILITLITYLHIELTLVV